MTTPASVYSQFGQTLHFAERTLTAALHEQLAQRDTRPETWYALTLIATRGPGLARERLSNELDGSRNVATSARELLARLAAEGLIHGDAEVDLTARGQGLYRSLRDYIGPHTAQLLSQFDIQDIETTVRTLQAITTRAAEDSPSSAE